jgi:hypothetical protein
VRRGPSGAKGCRSTPEVSVGEGPRSAQPVTGDRLGARHSNRPGFISLSDQLPPSPLTTPLPTAGASTEIYVPLTLSRHRTRHALHLQRRTRLTRAVPRLPLTLLSHLGRLAAHRLGQGRRQHRGRRRWTRSLVHGRGGSRRGSKLPWAGTR